MAPTSSVLRPAAASPWTPSPGPPHHAPRWNPINVCSYHLQEAGAPLSRSLPTPWRRLSESWTRSWHQARSTPPSSLPWSAGSASSSTQASASWRKPARCGPSPGSGTASAPTCYHVDDPKLRRFRYGVQVNSLGLTESQPENNVTRIVLETLGVTLSTDARARAIQLPAWNEALGLPRPWDQQWSLRIQQILAYETDLLEYDDIFEGSLVIESRTVELIEAAATGTRPGAGAGRHLLRSRDRRGQGPPGAQPGRTHPQDRVGPATGGGRQRVHHHRAVPSRRQRSHPAGRPRRGGGADRGAAKWRAARSAGDVAAAFTALRRAATDGADIMETIALAHAGARQRVGRHAAHVFGEYRAPTGSDSPGSTCARDGGGAGTGWRPRQRLGGPPRLLVAKPGLDGHSNGAEQIAVAARDAVSR